MAAVTSSVRAAPRAASVSPSERRRLPRGIVSALLRTRPGVVSEHFSVHWRVLAGAPGVLFMAIPKRLLSRAVDRNAVRRVAREAWRAAALAGAPVAAMLRMTRLPPARGVRHRKAIVRAELDAAFRTLGLRMAGPPPGDRHRSASSGPGPGDGGGHR
ncbi:MAG: hypothetical protein EHM83_07835 [Burkholderiales bacterium]|nr:MAG: hypothetical protein EHM83_07835 [Burkholderiales bacterium]